MPIRISRPKPPEGPSGEPPICHTTSHFSTKGKAVTKVAVSVEYEGLPDTHVRIERTGVWKPGRLLSRLEDEMYVEAVAKLRATYGRKILVALNFAPPSPVNAL